VGDAAREALLGGTTIGQPTLVRFYALHCFVLPALTAAFTAWHLWRIRKDGGLAAADRVVDEAVASARATPPRAGKTYTLLGTTAGDTVASVAPSALLADRSVASVPNLVRRAAVVVLGVWAVSSLLGLLVPAPLEAPADPRTTPNPAKAPWYFLWLQELVADLTFRVGGWAVDGALLGGVVVPGLLVALLAAWPWLDRSPREAAGVWFHPSRRRQNAVFLAILVAIAVLGVVGTFFRGPYWAWTWPWEAGPSVPTAT
jgi:quinol-cytochrome oxidoreductase complex cytochrome b subunit